jgi:LmbE family N-acetylglucosaminyl deacetylase
METPDLTRVLVVATHPDDDVIGAGGLIQRAISSGGALRVLFVTAGERNDWPQRAMLRRWRLTATDRAEWARLRRGEAACALDRIGAGAKCSFFLGFPDQRLSELARRGDASLLDAIAAHVAEFRPALVIAPSYFDVHTDHRASSYFVHQAVAGRVPIATYLVHGQPPTTRTLFTIRLTAEEQQQKRNAIACHESQLLLSRNRFLGYARATETFYASEYDLVGVDSAMRERMIALRHALGAVLGALRG